MKNVKMAVKGSQLTITVDLSKDSGTSKSGNSKIVASTGGNVQVPNHPDIKIGLNVYKPV